VNEERFLKKQKKKEAVYKTFYAPWFYHNRDLLVCAVKVPEAPPQTQLERRFNHRNHHHALPISNQSFGNFSPSTIDRTTGSALEKFANITCGMFSLVQYVARSFSPSGFSLAKSMSACFAADMSGVGKHAKY
jgi:hypothetical protein